jgi:hypothetical protein
MKIDFTSNDFRFISNQDEYYIGETKCTGDHTDWNTTKKIEDGWGMFEGLTMVPYKGYDGDLPRMDEDTSNFSEFSIYYKGELINDLEYSDLQSKILSDNREDKINRVLI